MNELTTELKKPLDKSNMGGDVASLNGLLGMINNPLVTGAEVPKGVDVTARMPEAITPTEQPPEPPAAPTPTPSGNATEKIFFTGRLMSGKDYCAEQAGCVVHGFADPLYAILNYFFGLPFDSRTGKQLPGARAMQQNVGQWGRGTLDKDNPLTPERAMFCHLMRTSGHVLFDPALKVQWQNFGLDNDLWVNATLARLAADTRPGRKAVTNVRFINEYRGMGAAGFQAWHVMVSPQTWAKRLATKKLLPSSPEVNNISEQLAAKLDKNVTEQISRSGKGPKIHCIWNDDEVPSPSPRLYSVPQFLQALAIGA